MLLAWTSLIVGVAAFVIGLTAPLAVDPVRVVWVGGFGAMAVWAGGMAIPRYRRAGRGRSVLAVTGITVGIATIASMGYAFAAMALAPTNVALPAPANWVSTSTDAPSSRPLGEHFANEVAPAAEAPAAAPAAEQPNAVDPIEAERLELAQSVGTATFVLRQIASPDGTWPASLAITTDGTTLMSPDGIILAPIPAGAQVLYSTSSDGSEYSLTLIGPSGVTASVLSTTGQVETSVP